MMNEIKKYYGNSIFTSVIGVMLAYTVGYMFGGSTLAAFNAVFTVGILSILEVSLSIDNAVVNAKVLKDMAPEWRHRFITWGMLIAVFGMRLVFPLLIVSVSTGMAPIQNPLFLISQFLNLDLGAFGASFDNVLGMAVYDPSRYEAVLKSSHAMIMGFGGSFLMMVALKFFMDEAKDNHWIETIESKLSFMGRFEAIQIFITLILAYIVSRFTHTPEDGQSFFVSAVFGAMSYVAVDWLEVIFGSDEDEDGNLDAAVSIAKNGLAGFIYLEVLDASFSFDGVVGAFALTNNIFLILIGLGIGAMFVRSVTLQLVDKGTLDEMKYLESSAFWAVGSLAAIMYLNVIVEIPEMITGLIGAAFITAGVIHSKMVQTAE